MAGAGEASLIGSVPTGIPCVLLRGVTQLINQVGVMTLIRSILATFPASTWRMNETSPEELGYGARISVWVRLALLLFCLFEANYKVEYGSLSQILNTLYILTAMSFNGYVFYRIWSEKAVTAKLLFALSVMDVLMLTFSASLSGGLESRYAVLYYFAIAGFAAVFSSTILNVGWVTLVAVLHILLIFISDPGAVITVEDEKVLIYRIGTLYAVAALVNLIMRIERIRRRDAVERETELQRQRIELSQNIHDNTAQLAFMIDLGIENVLERIDVPRGELAAKLDVTSKLSKSVMWELRHPIDGGQVFKGEELSHVLRAHASTFTVITEVPAELKQAGSEPPLSVIEKSLLFSIAHNALTNAFRHSQADAVTIRLEFGDDEIRVEVQDDGIGLPEEYETRGHGFRNMKADAERIGGRLEVGPGEDGRGTTVTCIVPRETA